MSAPCRLSDIMFFFFQMAPKILTVLSEEVGNWKHKSISDKEDLMLKRCHLSEYKPFQS